MKNLITFILIASILAGQLIKLPVANNSGPTLLDFSAICLLLYGLVKLKFKLKKPPAYILAAGIFVSIASLSLLITPLHLNKFEYLISFSYILRFASIILLGWIIYSEGLKLSLEKILTFSGVGLAILGLTQFILFPNLTLLENQGWDPHFFRTVSTFLDPNFAGAYFVLTLILLINQKQPSIVYFIIVYIALLTTFSRSSYLMFLISGLTFSFLKKSRKIFISTIILFIILLMGFKTYSQLVAQPRGIDREQSASHRFNTWEQGLTILQKSPFFGVGFNTYRYGIREYGLGNEQFIQSRGSSSNDSSLLFVAATTGIVGLIIYLPFLATLFKYAYPNNPSLIAAMSGLLVHSFFANSLFYPFILVWIILKASDIKD